jgi:hypothetical protein
MKEQAPKTARELRNFALVMTVGLGIIGGLLLWKDRAAAPYLLGLAAAFLISGLLFPKSLRPIEWLWMKLALFLGIIMTFIILNFTFFVAITPMGLIMRLLGKRPLAVGFDRDRSSFWEPVDADGPWGRPDKPY